MKTSERGDRRVERTRRLLTEALIELILERGWDAISVQDLCDRADVGRSTFYTHYADKEDVLVGGLDGLGRFLRAQAPAPRGDGTLRFAHGLIEHVQEQRRLVRAIVGKNSGRFVQQHFRQLLLELVREDLAGLVRAGPDLESAVHFITGGFFELLTWWAEATKPIEASELEARFHELSRPTLLALKRAHAKKT